MPVEVLRGFEEAFGCMILEGYGLSETSPVACFNHPDRERKPGSIGTPIERRRDEGSSTKTADEVAAGEVGEIAIRGHNVMKGYWNRPDATADAIDADGWFYSGDMARIDEDGYYFIVDRKKDLIIRGGYNVYPREIEEVLYEHPAVREAAVIGVPHDELGEEVGAAVALKAGATATAQRSARLRQGSGRGVQVPAARVVRRRAAQGPDRQDPQARDRAAGRRGVVGVAGGSPGSRHGRLGRNGDYFIVSSEPAPASPDSDDETAPASPYRRAAMDTNGPDFALIVFEHTGGAEEAYSRAPRSVAGVDGQTRSRSSSITAETGSSCAERSPAATLTPTTSRSSSARRPPRAPSPAARSVCSPAAGTRGRARRRWTRRRRRPGAPLTASAERVLRRGAPGGPRGILGRDHDVLAGHVDAMVSALEGHGGRLVATT